jgi:hypothetical protein
MARRVASVHPVHSPKCSQITGGRCAGAANTSATLGTKDEESPMVAVRNVQNFMKSRLVTPLPSNPFVESFSCCPFAPP